METLAARLIDEVNIRIAARIRDYLEAPSIIARLNTAAYEEKRLAGEHVDEVLGTYWQQLQQFNVQGIFHGDRQGRGVAVFKMADGTHQSRIITDPPTRNFHALDDRGNRTNLLKQAAWDPRERPWYQKAIQTRRAVWSPIYTFTNGALGITAAQAWRQPDGSPMGVVGIDLDLEFIGTFLKELNISPNGRVFLIEKNGLMIAGSKIDGRGMVRKTDTGLERITAGDTPNPVIRTAYHHARLHTDDFKDATLSHPYEFHIDDERYWARLSELKLGTDLNWLVVIVIPDRDFMSEIRENMRQTTWLTMVTLLFATLLGGTIASGIAHPIMKLSDKAVQLASGDFEQSIQEQGSRELRTLARAFNSMGGQLQETFHSLQRMNLELEDRVDERTRELKRSEGKFKLALQSTRFHLWEWNPATDDLRFDPDKFIGLGYSTGDLPHTLEEMLKNYHPEDVPTFRKAIDVHLTGGKDLFQCDYRYRDRAGNWVWFSAHGNVVEVDEQGEPTMMIGLVFNVDQRKRAEEQIVLASQVFANAGEGILIMGPNHTILDVNPAFLRITGYTPEEVKGSQFTIPELENNPKGLLANIQTALDREGSWSGEMWDQRKNGELFPKWINISAVKSGNAKISNFVAIFSDISHQKATEQKLEQMAYYDPLTALPNRVLFRERLEHQLRQSLRNDTLVAVLFIDLDRFKSVNDTLGHAAGDQLLVEVAKRLNACVRKTDTVARMGGDEFTAILVDVKKQEDAGRVAGKIIDLLQQAVILLDQEVYIGASIGIGMFPDNGTDFDTITKNADTAMYHAKSSGRGNYKFFDPHMNAKALNLLTLEKDLRNALRNHEFILHYQPKIDARTGQLVGMEALLRWNHPTKGLVSPGELIPVAEETGLIVELGAWVLHTACRENREWLDRGHSDLRVAVNLSVRQFQDKGFIDMVRQVMEDTGLPSANLELEITESMVMGDVDEAIATLETLRGMGLHLSIDDFGTGYSSLSYLKRFPVDTLKIDQSFVRNLNNDPNDAAIVAAVISMAKSLGLAVVAEGVETVKHMKMLKKQDCFIMQGYHFSKPLPSKQFSDILQKGKRFL